MTTPAPRLQIDLVPRTAWGSNLRSRYPQHWDAIRKSTYRAARMRCECCGANARLECHEVWDYSAPPVQRLVRLVALCNLCHAAQHFGAAQARGEADAVASHILEVNGWSDRQLEQHIANAFALWRARNRIEWATDTAELDKLLPGLTVDAKS